MDGVGSMSSQENSENSVCVCETWCGTRPSEVGGSFILSSLLLATAYPLDTERW